MPPFPQKIVTSVNIDKFVYFTEKTRVGLRNTTRRTPIRPDASTTAGAS